MEQVRTLLTMREQLVREKGAKQNALHVLKRKHYPTPLAIRIASDAVDYLKDRWSEIDAEVKRFVSSAPDARAGRRPRGLGAGRGLPPRLSPVRGDGRLHAPARRQALLSLAGRLPLGLRERKQCPAATVEPGYGPSAMRKLFYLASMRLVTIEGSATQAYYRRKVAEGKQGRLVLEQRRQ